MTRAFGMSLEPDRQFWLRTALLRANAVENGVEVAVHKPVTLISESMQGAVR